MKRKLVSYICLIVIFMESVPVSALSNITSEVIPLEHLEEPKTNEVAEESNEKGDENLNNVNKENAVAKEDDLQGTEVKTKLEDNIFNMYIVDKIGNKKENELAFSIGFDEKERKFRVSNQSQNQLSKENLDTIIYKINIYDKENKEKLNIELLGNDTGNSEKLNILKETKYEIGDFIKITSFDPKNGLNILGEIQGDINKDKEDYSDGVDNIDYIGNVRFEITESGIKSVYNQAPVFEGLDKVDENLNGLKVTDDHDGVIPNSNVIVTEEGDYITYTVSDSWGRTTQASKPKTVLYNEGESSGENQSTLADNTITVKGIEFVTDNGSNDIRFKINFNPGTKIITITEKDGKILSTTNSEYFRFALHGSNGKVKHEVKLNGRDRSDSKKLDAINNIKYEIGDYISIWHEESDTKLNIAGQVSDVDTPNNKQNFNEGVPKATLKRRFKLTEQGLQLVTNNPPVINGADSPIEIQRGDNSVDLLKGVTVTDALDGEIPNTEIKISGLDINTSGIYDVKYEVEDSWGEKSEVIRKITVRDTNDIDGFKFDIMTKDGYQRLFTIGFDELLHEIKITNKSQLGKIDNLSTEDAFIFRIYNQFGKIKKTFKIKGNTEISTSNVLSSMNGFKYVNGDYVSVWVANKLKGIQLNGNIRIEGIDDENPGPELGPGVGEAKEPVIDGKTGTEETLEANPAPEGENEPKDGLALEANQESVNVQVPKVVNYNEDVNNNGSVNDSDYVDDSIQNFEELDHTRFRLKDGKVTAIPKVVNYNEDVNNNGSVNDSDYVDDSIQNFEELDHTRFRLKDGKVTAIYNQAPQIHGVEDKTIKRGETFEPLKGVTVSDDRDDNATIKVDDIKVTFAKGVTAESLHLTKGKHIVTYRLKDSWGRETVVNRTITVDPKNKLEEHQITLKSNSTSSDDKDILKIGFDTIKKHLRVEYFNKYLVVEGNSYDTALKIIVYGENNKKKSEYELKQETRLTKDDIDKISKISYDDGDRIAIEVYNAENGISITGDIVTPEANYNSGFKPLESSDKEFEDIMKNTRFKISENGFDDEYNQAPQIIGADEVMVVKNRRFDPRVGISVSDDKDENLGFRIKDNGILDTSEIGTYTVSYWTMDSWGRVSSIGRVVHVVPEYADTNIELKNTNSEQNDKPLISIGINRFGNRFVLNSEVQEDIQPPQIKFPEGEETVPTTPEVTPETLNSLINRETNTSVTESSSSGEGENLGQDGQTPPATDESLPNEGEENVIFKLTVFNNNHEVNKFTLKEGEVITPEKKEELESIVLGQGYTFSIWSNNHNNLMVKGNITKDTQTTSNDEGFSNENYADGISSEDLMNNVRFTVKGENLQALYNSKPTITIANNSEGGENSNEERARTGETTEQYDSNAIIMYRGETPNLKKNVSVNDDRDNLDISDLKITIDGEEATRKKLEEISKSTSNGTVYKGNLQYTIKDKWGRESDPVTRQVVIKPGMSRHKILLRGRTGDLANTFFDSLGIIFNPSTMKFEFVERSGEKFHTYNTNQEMYRLKILDGNTKEVKEGADWIFNGGDRATDNKYNNIKEINIKYGDIIKITTNQGPKLSISGEIYNTGNDYTNGVTGHIVANTEFKITENGLVENYTESIQIPEDKNMISILTGFVGSVFFNITYDIETKKLVVEPGDVKEPLEYRHKNNNIVRFEFYNSNGEVKSQFNLIGEHRNDSEDVINLFKSLTLNPGDYFTMVPQYEPNKKLFRILGEMKKHGDVEDFSDGVDSIEKSRNTRFYITSSGNFEAVYNEAPEINIPNEIKVEENSEYDSIVNIQYREAFNAQTGVTVTDDIDKNLTASISGGTVNVNQIGYYTVNYRATDTWRRATTKRVRYYVRPKSFFNKINVYTESDKETPAFEISFDNETNKYTVKSYSGNVMDSHDNPESVFKIWILDSNNRVKGEVNLLGYDQANSEKLNALNNVNYASGDKIKVWRYSESPNNIDTLKITGNVIEEKESYNDGIQNIDNMNNVSFEVTNEGFKSIYNQEAQITGVEDKVIYIGDDFDPKEGLQVNDPEDGAIDNNEVEIEYDFDTNRTGEYEVTYTVHDSWGRYSQKTITIKVVSKSTRNTIEFYQNSNTTENKLFTIGLDYTTGNYKVEGDANANEQFDSSHPEELYAKIVIYDRYGKVLKDVELLGKDTVNSEKLTSLNKVKYGANQTISLYHKNPQNTVITNDVLSEDIISRSSYNNGFTDEDEMAKTRFKITDRGLLAVKHKNAKFTGLNSDITITRGEDPDFFTGVTITHPTDEVQEDDVKIENFDKFDIGTQIITYKYVDSWGIASTATRKVIVNPINKLEKNVVEIINNTKNHKKIGEISFDTINMNLHAKFESSNLSGMEAGELLTIALFDVNGESKSEITITKDSIMNGSAKEAIEAIPFDYDDYISYKSYDSDNGFAITGDIKEQREEYDDGVQDKDNIDNVRFIIEEEGLKSKYNAAPQFNEFDELEIYKGEEPDFIKNITITDDIDGNIDPNNITIDEGFDADTLGKQTVTYRVEDSWGREATKERTVWVKSLVDTNKAGFYNQNGELLFAIGFNSKTQHYILEKGKIEGPMVPDAGTDPIIKLHVFNKDGSKKYTIPIRGNIDVDFSIVNLLKIPKYEYGTSINIEILDYNKVKFKGTGKYFKDGFEDNANVDYEKDFITNNNRDYLDNVRLKITELGTQVIYNKAPNIEIEKGEEESTSGSLERYKYKTLDEYDLLEGIIISDDRDELSLENVVIKKVENSSSTKEGSNVQEEKGSKSTPSDDNILTNENADKKLVLGNNTITYSIVDNWGRKSAEVTRTINISPSINRNIIQLDRFDYEHSVDQTKPKRELAVEIKFDDANKSIKASVINAGNFGKHSGLLNMYRIEIRDKSGNQKFGYDIKDNHTSDEFARSLNNATFNNQDLKFEYGDTLKMTTTQGPMHKIQGPVLNGGEDYSDGTNLSYVLANTTFTITENGLEAEVIDQYQDNEGENTITWLAGYNGLIGFRMRLNRTDMTLEIKDSKEKHIDTEDHTGNAVFSIKLFDSEGNQKYKAGQSQTSDYGVYDGRDEVSNSVVPQYQNMQFSVGDYFEIKIPKTSRSKNLRISGNIKMDKRIDENYEDGIDDTEYIDNVRLYITEDGLEARYNEAPVVTGAEDGVIVKGRSNQLGEVTVTDDWDKREQITFTEKGDINDQQVGAYMKTYKATDSWGRSSEFDRFVVVQAPPRIELNKGADLTLELGSMPKDQVENYLRYRLVAITDEEDDRDGKPLDITIDDDGFDPDTVGSYNINYRAVDSDEYKTEKTITVNVVRTISVSPTINIPFQVVTNLKDKNADEFISGVLNLKNNGTSEVDVFVESFTKQTNSGELELVGPEEYNWDNLPSTETMKKMALGMYVKSGLIGKSSFIKEAPLWLKPNEINNIPLGRIPRAQSIGDPYICKLSFTSKHGKNFIGGGAKGKFDLVFRFE